MICWFPSVKRDMVFSMSISADVIIITWPKNDPKSLTSERIYRLTVFCHWRVTVWDPMNNNPTGTNLMRRTCTRWDIYIDECRDTALLWANLSRYRPLTAIVNTTIDNSLSFKLTPTTCWPTVHDIDFKNVSLYHLFLHRLPSTPHYNININPRALVPPGTHYWE